MLTHERVQRHLCLAAVLLMRHRCLRSAATIVGKHDQPSMLYKPAQASARYQALFHSWTDTFDAESSGEFAAHGRAGQWCATGSSLCA